MPPDSDCVKVVPTTAERWLSERQSVNAKLDITDRRRIRRRNLARVNKLSSFRLFSCFNFFRFRFFPGPPSRPENPQILSVDQSSAVVSWTKPSNFGGRSEIWYRIECRECPSNAQYQPAKSKFNATKLTLTNLEPSTVYTVFIYAENDVSSQIDALPMYAVVEIVTRDLSPMQITNLKIDSISENQIALSWDSPTDAGGGGTVFFAEYDTMMSVGGELNGHPQRRIATGVVSDFESTSKKFVQYYQIKQTVKDWPTNVTVKTSNEGKITMQNLMENVEYVFEVSKT